MTEVRQGGKSNNIAKPRPKKARESFDDADSSSHAGVNQDDAGIAASMMLKTLEREIIPRLILSCRSSASQPRGANSPSATAPTKRDFEPISVEDFADLLIREDVAEVSRYLTSLRNQGASLEWLYIDLMTPAARHIGYLWEEDLCSMIDVTLAVGRLQHILRELSPEFEDQSKATDVRRRAIILPMPGEQHTFGVSMISEFFRREGWDLWGWPLPENKDLIALVRREWFAIVGISLAADVNQPGLAALIRELRRVSRNPHLGIMVGGPMFLKNPKLAKELGADATAVDAKQAVVQAESLLDLVLDGAHQRTTPQY
jgi:MerR family transcriptional regulator, light-induced transcriptional regulator